MEINMMKVRIQGTARIKMMVLYFTMVFCEMYKEKDNVFEKLFT